MLSTISGLAVARVVGSALQATLLILLARDMGAARFGELALVLAIGALLGTLSGFGSVTQALQFADSEADRGEARFLYLVRIATAFAVAAFSGMLAWSYEFAPAPMLAIMAWIFSDMVVDLSQSILLGQQLHTKGNILISGRRVLPLCGFGLGAVQGQSWWGLAAGCVLTVVAGHALVWPRLRATRPVPGVIRRSVHFWGSTVMTSFQNSDIVLVGALSSSPVLVGYYSVASRLGSPLNIFTQALIGVLMPKMARESAGDRAATYRKARYYCLAFGVVMLASGPVLGEALVMVLGPSYDGARIFVIGVTLSVAVSAFAQVNAAFLYASGKARSLAHLRYWSVPLGLGLVAGAALSRWEWCLALAPIALQFVQWGTTQRAVSSELVMVDEKRGGLGS